MLIVQTPRLRLRWFSSLDAGFVRRLLNDPGWLKNIGDRGVRTNKQADAWIQRRLISTYGRLGFGLWAVEKIANSELVGMCGLVLRESLPEVDVGYALMPAYRGQGYASEAACACVRYGHDVLGLREIWGITSRSNAGSAGVLRRAGLRDDGLHWLAGETEQKWLFKGPRQELGDDRAQIDALVRRFFNAFGNRNGALPTLAALPHYFRPDATVHITDPQGAVTAVDVNGFIAPRAELLLRGRLGDFHEYETLQRTDISGPIAQRWLRYEKQGVLDGQPFTGGGHKAMQFVRTPRGWQIASLAWADDAQRS
jgi:RimJ/RimL family protein N-acetyltransferase